MAIGRAGEINLEYYVEGQGPPLLMIMGFAGQAASWGEPFLEELRPHFRCIRFSNRGTGDSDKPQEQPTIRMMADDTIALLDTLGIERPHVLGISMGGMISQEIAISHPQRVNGLVLGCTAAGAPNAVAAAPEVYEQMAPVPGMPIEDQVRKAWPALVTDGFIERGHAFLEGMLQTSIRNPTPLDSIMKQLVAIGGFSAKARLHEVNAPTLVIHGDADRLMPPANGDIVAGAIPGAELRTIQGVGHMFFWEKPRESARIITEFLARVPASV